MSPSAQDVAMLGVEQNIAEWVKTHPEGCSLWSVRGTLSGITGRVANLRCDCGRVLPGKPDTPEEIAAHEDLVARCREVAGRMRVKLADDILRMLDTPRLPSL